MKTINLYNFIKEEKACKWFGCKYNDIGFCEYFDSMFLNDIIVKSSDLINSKEPEKVTFDCYIAKSKINHCMCGKEIDNWNSVDGFEHAFGKYNYDKVCDCGD